MHALCIDPSYRGQGIAKHLVSYAWKVVLVKYILIAKKEFRLPK